CSTLISRTVHVVEHSLSRLDTARAGYQQRVRRADIHTPVAHRIEFPILAPQSERSSPRRLTFGLRFLTAAQVENDIGILAQHRFERDPRILRYPRLRQDIGTAGNLQDLIYVVI